MTSTNSPMCSIQRFPKMNGRFDCPASLAWKPADAVGIGRMPKNSDGRKQLGDEWKIKLPYAVGHKARAKAKQGGISLSSLARRAITGYLRTRNQDEHPLF